MLLAFSTYSFSEDNLVVNINIFQECILQHSVIIHQTLWFKTSTFARVLNFLGGGGVYYVISESNLLWETGSCWRIIAQHSFQKHSRSIRLASLVWSL